MAARTLPPFRADHVGSLLRPPALLDARARHRAGDLDDVGLRAAEDTAIRDAVALLVVEVHGELLVGRVDALELVDEVHVPRRTPELAVGRRTDAGLALQRDDVADGGVLGPSQAVVIELARLVPGPRVEQLGRPEQAPDVVGTERRKRSGCHAFDVPTPPVLDAVVDRPEHHVASPAWLTYSSSTTSRG